jgi:hypothetical protein
MKRLMTELTAIRGAIAIVAITLALLVVTDVLILKPLFGLGVPFDEIQDLQRSPAPYIYFKGAPNALDHDQWGYRWVPQLMDAAALRLAFLADPPAIWAIHQ